MNSIDAIGFIAGMLTTVSFLPQVVKTWKTRSARDISIWMFLLLAVGIALWIIYGVLTEALPVILANSATLVLIFIIVALKIAYERKQ